MRRRWFIVFMLLVVWTGQISQLPIDDTATTNNDQSKSTERKPRQLDGKECCPCPSPAQTEDLEVQANSRTASVLPAEELRSVCDCPCRLRDSEAAASSMFDFPSQMRSVTSFVRPSDHNEETKPLLHPEVGLANSVLQTLREATEEEYQEAVTREAARAAADSGSFESNSEPAKNIVTIILNPHPLPANDDDIISSETHTHESRCIHSPLGRSLLEPSSIPRSNYLTEVRHLPSLGRQNSGRSSLLHVDNGLSASNVHEAVVERPEGTQSEITNPLLDLRPKNKIMDETKVLNNVSSLRNTFKVSDRYNNNILNSKINTDSDCKTSMSVKERVKKLNALLTSSPVHDMDGLAAETINVQDLRDDTGSEENKNKYLNLKSNPLASPKKEAVTPLLKPLIPHNLLNLKDVELIPTTRIETENNGNFKIPNLNLPSINDLIEQSRVRTQDIMKLPTLSDLFRNTALAPNKNTETDENMTENSDSFSDTAIDSNEKIHKIHTEILDVIPSPSEKFETISNAETVSSDPTSRSAQNIEDNLPSQNEIQEGIDPEHEISSTENIQQLDSTELVEVNSDTDVDDNDDEEDSDPDINNIDIISSQEESNENRNTDNQNEQFISNDPPGLSDTIDNLNNKRDSLLDTSNEHVIAKPALTKDNRSAKLSKCLNQHSNTMTMSNVKDDIQQISSASVESEEISDTETINDSSELKSNHIQETSNNTCSNGLVTSKSADMQNLEISDMNGGENDMTIEASNPISSLILPKKPKGLLGSILRQSPVVQPIDLINQENDFLTPPSIDPLNINLPTLNELREGLANIFTNNELGRKDDENEFSTDEDIIESSMATDSSAPNAKFTIPSLEPAKEVNLNIIKINPLKLGEPNNLKSIGSGLNLDSLTARLKVPSSTWKPLKLESTFSKGGGLLGASLSLEPPNKIRPSLLSSSGLGLPDLERIRSTLRARTENVLKTPKLSLNIDTLMNSEPVRQLDDLRQSIRSNTASAMSNFQQTLESSLNEAKIQTDNLLGNSRFAQPENLLDIARFDVDDKLQELHSNIADHLLSMHEKLMNPPTLSSLGSPLLGFPFDSSLLGKSSPSWNRRKPNTKRKSSKSFHSLQKPIIRTGKFRTSKVSDKKPSSSKKTIVVNRSKENKFKIPNKDAAAVTLKMPKANLMVTQKPIRLQSKKIKDAKSTPSRSIERNPVIQRLQVSPLRPTPDIKRVMPPWLSKNSLKSESDKFRAALFTTTTTRPRLETPSYLRANNPMLLERLPSIIPTSPQKTTNRSPGFKLLEMPHSRLQSILQSIRDADGSPNEQVLTKTLPDFKILKSSSFDSKNQRPDLLSDIIKPIFKVNISKIDLPERTGSFKPISQTLKSSNFIEAEKDSSSFEEIETLTKSKPNIIDQFLLSKLRDSVRKKPFDQDNVGSVLRSRNDMAEGASKNLQNIVVLDEPMKENVKYRCKMVCTRE